MTDEKKEGLAYTPAVPPAKPKKNSRKRLTAEQLDGMSPAEIRAVAIDRGYKNTFGGRKVLATAFLAAQDADDTLEDGEK